MLEACPIRGRKAPGALGVAVDQVYRPLREGLPEGRHVAPERSPDRSSLPTIAYMSAITSSCPPGASARRP